MSDHILDLREYHVALFAGKTSTKVLQNQRRPNLTVYKHDADTGEPIANTVFEVRAADGHSVDQIKTDGEGKAELRNLLPGVYEIIEKSVPAPYLLDAENAYSNDIKVTLEENDKGYELRYHLPQDWMADAAYPVILDPVVQPVSNTFTIRDKTVSQRNSELAGFAYIAATTCSSGRRTSGGKSNAPRQAAGRGRNTGPVRMTV